MFPIGTAGLIKGQRLYIKNETEDKIKDLYFIIPEIEVHSKVRNICIGERCEELILDKYQGDLKFYFKSNCKEKFIFEKFIQKIETADGKNDDYKSTLVFKITKKDEKHLVEFVSNDIDDILKDV